MKPSADQKSVMDRYMAGPPLLAGTVAGLAGGDLDRAVRPGGWTIRKIVHHISDGDDLWKTAIKHALGSIRTEFSLDWYRELSQDDWTERWAYIQRPVEESLALLQSNNGSNND